MSSQDAAPPRFTRVYDAVYWVIVVRYAMFISDLPPLHGWAIVLALAGGLTLAQLGVLLFEVTIGDRLLRCIDRAIPQDPGKALAHAWRRVFCALRQRR